MPFTVAPPPRPDPRPSWITAAPPRANAALTRPSSDLPCQGEAVDHLAPCVAQHAGTRLEGGRGRQDVVHQDHARGRPRALREAEGAAQVPQPPGAVETVLLGGRTT